MPLAAGKPILKLGLQTTWTNVYNSYATSAVDFSNDSMTFAQTGIPMTTDTGLLAGGQAITGAVTVSPGIVAASGLGGIDTVSPGIGLAAAKAILISTLVSVFANTSNSYATAATGISDAIFNFLSQAKILTTVTAVAAPGVPVPPTSGPVGPSPWIGTGVGGIEVLAGAGLPTGLAALVALVTAEYTNFYNTPIGVSTAIANALETFFMTANVTTTDTGTAAGGPASVTPIPPFAGSTLPPGSPATGAGTGIIA